MKNPFKKYSYTTIAVFLLVLGGIAYGVYHVAKMNKQKKADEAAGETVVAETTSSNGKKQTVRRVNTLAGPALVRR